MTRKSAPKNIEDDCASHSDGVRADVESQAGSFSGMEDSERMLDLEPEEQSPFLRSQKRIPVRRGPLPRKAANRLKTVLALAVLGCMVVAAGFGLYGYARNSWRFRVDSSDLIQVTGNRDIDRAEIMEVFGGDISRNIFLVPLDERRKQLEQAPWVQSASVMRLLPNRIAVEVKERTPIAFARVGARVMLVDANGILMDMPANTAAHYSFPVIEGMRDGDPLSMRAARMMVYQSLMHDLDGSGAHYSQDISDVDLGDPEDVKVAVADPNGELLVHLGTSNFLDRYKIYVSHIQEWRQEHPSLRSVDLRYDHEIVLDPDLVPPNDGAVASVAAQTTKTQAAEPASLAPGAAKTVAKKPPAKSVKQARAEAKKKKKSEKMRTLAHVSAPARAASKKGMSGPSSRPALARSGDSNKSATSTSTTPALVGKAESSTPATSKLTASTNPKPAGNTISKPAAKPATGATSKPVGPAPLEAE